GDYDAELIRLFKRYVRSEVDAGGDETGRGFVIIPAWMVPEILAALERAPQTGSGPHGKSQWDAYQDERGVQDAERLRRELMAQAGMKKSEARKQAAKAAKWKKEKGEKKKSRTLLSEEQIAKRMRWKRP